MQSGYYWVRIRSLHQGRWTVAKIQQGEWFHGTLPLPSDSILEIGKPITGPES